VACVIQMPIISRWRWRPPLPPDALLLRGCDGGGLQADQYICAHVLHRLSPRVPYSSSMYCTVEVAAGAVLGVPPTLSTAYGRSCGRRRTFATPLYAAAGAHGRRALATLLQGSSRHAAAGVLSPRCFRRPLATSSCTACCHDGTVRERVATAPVLHASRSIANVASARWVVERPITRRSHALDA
jgi:hypothetical protein